VYARYTLTKRKLSTVAVALDAEFADDDEKLYRPRFNVAPTDQAWIVERGADRRVLRPATWNYLVSGGRPLINLRGERVESGAGFRDAFASRPCAVVTDGFFEWPGKGLAPYGSIGRTMDLSCSGDHPRDRGARTVRRGLLS
jgi:putative SOS response-associated peptidase YedK